MNRLKQRGIRIDKISLLILVTVLFFDSVFQYNSINSKAAMGEPGGITVTVTDCLVGQCFPEVRQNGKIISTGAEVSNFDIIYEFQVETPDGTVWLGGVPEEIGEYIIRATVTDKEGQSGTYYSDRFALETVADNVDLEMDDIFAGETLSPKLTWRGIDVIGNSMFGSSFVYQNNGGTGDKYNGLPTEIGEYKVTAHVWNIAHDEDEDEVSVNVTIKQNKGQASITISDITYGEALSPVITSSTHDISAAKVTYGKSTDSEDSYTGTVPTMPGKYRAKCYFASNAKYEEVKAYADFEIKKKKGIGSLSIESVKYGEKIMPTYSSETNGTDNVKLEYKLSEESDSSYTSTEPSEAGKYTARATFPETDTAEACVATVTFEIFEKEKKKNETLKQSGSTEKTDKTEKAAAPVKNYDSNQLTKRIGNGSVTANNRQYGVKPGKVSISTSTFDVSKAVIEFKQYGAGDDTFSAAIPEKVGKYIVRVYFPENAGYAAMSVTDDFEITYMDAPKFSINGTRGDNGYYKSKLTIVPEDGYLVSASADTGFAASLTLDENSSVDSLYFKNSHTGGMSDGVPFGMPPVDTKAPILKNSIGSDIIYADTLNIGIYDINLLSASLDNKKCILNGANASEEISAEGGKRTVTLEATDKAGNTFSKTFVIAAEWLKNKIIPANVSVSLEPGEQYFLDGTGDWKVSGDSIVYKAGSSIYVDDNKTLIFTKSGK